MVLHVLRSRMAFILGNEVRSEGVAEGIRILCRSSQLGHKEVCSSAGESRNYDHHLRMGRGIFRAV